MWHCITSNFAAQRRNAQSFIHSTTDSCSTLLQHTRQEGQLNNTAGKNLQNTRQGWREDSWPSITRVSWSLWRQHQHTRKLHPQEILMCHSEYSLRTRGHTSYTGGGRGAMSRPSRSAWLWLSRWLRWLWLLWGVGGLGGLWLGGLWLRLFPSPGWG